MIKAIPHPVLLQLFIALKLMADYFKIGKLVAAFGVNGQLILQHELGKKTALKDLQVLFIEEKKNAFIPWFIRSVKIKSDNEVYISLEGIDNRESAQKLVQQSAWFSEADFKKFAAKSAPAKLLGYTIMDGEKSLGPILEVIEQPHQLLCRLEINAKEVLVPVNEAFLKKIDHNAKKVMVTLPEGLLDIYLT